MKFVKTCSCVNNVYYDFFYENYGWKSKITILSPIFSSLSKVKATDIIDDEWKQAIRHTDTIFIAIYFPS